jgi:hypothetical protein
MNETDTKQPADPPAKSGLLGGGRKVVLGVFGALALLAGGVTNWDTIEHHLFPAKPASEASIVAKVEPDITLQEFDRQARLSAERPPSTAAVVTGGSPRASPGYRFVVYAAPAIAQPATGKTVEVTLEEQAKSGEQTKSDEQKIKEEGEKVKEEAKRDEENTAREKSSASAEQKSAEAREREEQKKVQEAKKRAEEPRRHDPVQAKAEEAKARRGVAKASATVQAKKRATVRPPSQRQIEVGTSAGRVEQVLNQAGLPERCRPTCSLKPIVEKALKATSSNVAEAAQEVRATASRGSGARVHFRVTLDGLEQKVVVLTYSLVQTNGAPPPEPYLDTVAVKHFTPVREREVIVGDCWVPVPSNSQQYYLLLTVYDGKTEVGSEDTSHFQ